MEYEVVRAWAILGLILGAVPFVGAIVLGLAALWKILNGR